MKITNAVLLFAVLVSAALSQEAFFGGGAPEIRSGPRIPEDCFFKVVFFPSANDNSLTFQQQFRPGPAYPPQPLPETCHAPNIVFTSFFLNEELSSDDQIVIPPPTNITNPSFEAKFTSEWLNKNNGTACVHLKQTSKPGLEQYLCSITYGVTPLYMVTFGTGNFTFDSDVYQGLVVHRQLTQSFGINYYIIGFNSSFPNITANLYASCGSTSNVLNSLSAAVTVTTTTDLSAYLPNMWLGYTLVKKNNAGLGDYLAIPSTSQAVLFTPGSGDGCWSLGISYSDILPDMNYCAGGCKITFILRDTNNYIYVMETAGVQTVDTSVGGGSGSGNGSGNGSGSGTGSGNGGNNGGNGGSASSAASMVFNAALLLISAAYLAL